MKYTLIIINEHGNFTKTYHESKAEVRRQINMWDTEDMTARVISQNGTVIYEEQLGIVTKIDGEWIDRFYENSNTTKRRKICQWN